MREKNSNYTMQKARHLYRLKPVTQSAFQTIDALLTKNLTIYS